MLLVFSIVDSLPAFGLLVVSFGDAFLVYCLWVVWEIEGCLSLFDLHARFELV